MITFEKQENGVLFTFENSDKYLYGDGTILVPFNSLAVIQDESDMITLRKSASWDIFLSGRFDTDFNYGSKEDAVDALKEALFAETGGVTEEEVEQMIDAATSGIPSSQVIEQLRTDVNAVSGDVDTLQDDVASKADTSAVTAVNDVLTAHTANTSIHVTSADKSAWDAKQDALTAGENITISGNVISAENNIIELTQEEYDALTEKDPDALYIITNAQEINMNDYATKTDLDEKADASALTAVSDAVTGKADASALTAVANDVQTVSGQVATKVETSDFNAFSAATDARIAEDEEVTAAALNDLAEGKQDTLISGENIKTINNISILGAGNITVSGGGGGGDYQYYSEDTTNESATIEVGHQSLSVDGNGVYVNGDTVVTEGALRDYVTSEDLEDNYYTQQTIDEKEEVVASALTELNLRVTEDEEVTAAALNDLDENKQDKLAYYEENTEDGWAEILITNDDGEGNTSDQHISIGGGATEIGNYQEYDDGQGNTGYTSTNIQFNNPEINIYVESDDNGETEATYFNITPLGATINNENVATEPYVDAALSGKADTSAVTAVQQSLSGKQDTLVSGTNIKTINNESILGSGNITISGGGGQSLVYYTEDTSNESATIDVQTDDGLGNRSENRVFVDGGDIIIESYNETDDGEGNTGTTDTQVDINSLGLSIIASSDDGIDTTQTELEVQPMGAYINSEPIATEPYVNAALSGKADTSAVTAAIDDAKAYYISFATLATVGIHDEDWDGIVAAIDDHRPIYAGYPRTDGGIIYYGVECMNKNSGNTQIVMTASDDNQHYFYTFVKNGSNDYSYTVDTRPYTTNQEKTAWSAKQDALSAGTGISISNNVISTSGVVMSQTVTQLVKLTQAAYDNLVTKDANTLYIISD